MWVYHTLKLVSRNTCPEKEVDTPTKKQSSATHCCKSDGGMGEVMGKKGNSDLNRSRELLPVNAFDHPIMSDRSHLLLSVGVGWGRSRTFGAHGERAIDCHLHSDCSLPQNVTFHLD
jgi:hypothetical protein